MSLICQKMQIEVDADAKYCYNRDMLEIPVASLAGVVKIQQFAKRCK